MAHKIVNRSEGIVRHILFTEGVNGKHFALCTYVKIKEYGIEIKGLPRDMVLIFPIYKLFKYKAPNKKEYNILREQLSLFLAYIYTDYKSQGHSLKTVIVDLTNC